MEGGGGQCTVSWICLEKIAEGVAVISNRSKFASVGV
jgi:hypothetical protein